MIKSDLQKAIKVLMNTEGGQEFIITVGKILNDKPKKDGYENRALEFFNKNFTRQH